MSILTQERSTNLHIVIKSENVESTVHESYTTSSKLTVVQSAERIGNRAAARRYAVNEHFVRRWRAEKDDLKIMPKLKRAQKGGVVPWPGLEEKLESWIKDQQTEGVPISMFHIQAQAKSMAEQMGITDFNGSRSWCYRFMKRKKLSPSSRSSAKDRIKLEPCENNSQLPNVYPSSVNKSYTAGFKLSIIKRAEEIGNRAASREFTVDESSVRRWRAEKDKLNGMPKLKRAQRGGVTPWPDLEERLESWIKEQHTEGVPVSMFHIRTQARLIAEQMGITGFTGGPNWCYRFMKRKKLSPSSRSCARERLKLVPYEENSQLPTVYLSPVNKSYRAGFKLSVIKRAEKIGNRAAAREFNVDESCIRRWRCDKEGLERMPTFKRARRGGGVAWPNLEEKLETWVKNQQDLLLPISLVEIRAQAILVAKQMGITSFRGGSSWCYRFLKRRKLSVGKKWDVKQNVQRECCEKMPFIQSSITNLIQQLELSKAQIINMSVVSYVFDCLLDRSVTNAEDEMSISDTRNGGIFCTCILACAANGDKLNPFVIFRQNNIPKGNYASDVIIRSNEKGWRCEEMVQEWLNEVWHKRGDIFEPRGILIVDSMLSELLESVKPDCERVSATVVAVPKDLSPLNLVIDKLFNCEMEHHWEKWRKRMNSIEEDLKIGDIVPDEIARWVMESWKSINTSTIISGFTEVKILASKSDQVSKDKVNLKKTKCNEGYSEITLEDREFLNKLFNSESDESDFDGFS